MKFKFIYILFLSILISSQSKVGTTAAQFLGIGVGARAMSMGGAFTSMVGEPSSLYWNPGSIANVENDQAEILNADWLIDTQWHYFGYMRATSDPLGPLYNQFKVSLTSFWGDLSHWKMAFGHHGMILESL